VHIPRLTPVNLLIFKKELQQLWCVYIVGVISSRMKPDLRVRTVGTRVCEEEYQALERLAQAQGQTLSEWTR